MTVKGLEVAASGPWCVRGSLRWPAGWALASSKAYRSLSRTIRRRPGLKLGSLPVATQWRTVLRGTRVMAATSSRSSRSERMASGRHHARSAAIGARRNAGSLFLRTAPLVFDEVPHAIALLLGRVSLAPQEHQVGDLFVGDPAAEEGMSLLAQGRLARLGTQPPEAGKRPVEGILMLALQSCL